MASISSPGIGIGIDVNQLLSDLIAATRAPAQNRLDFKEATAQAELSALGTLKSALSSFRSSISPLATIDLYNSLGSTSSDDTVLSATAKSGAVVGDYAIKVSTLAKSHTIATADGAFTAITDTVGTGTLTFKFGTTTYSSDEPTGFVVNAETETKTVSISESDKTLAGVRDAVNNADIGVLANIVYDGGDYRLTFTSKESGLANSLEVTVTDDDGDNDDNLNLSRLSFNSTSSNAIFTTKAVDAAFTINGIETTSTSNTVTDAINGVTLNLKKIQDVADSDITVSITGNPDVVTNAVRNFVQEFNGLQETLNALSGYDADTKQAGLLQGDSAVRDVGYRLRKQLNTRIQGLSGDYTSLANVGVTTQRDGTLSVDSAKLNAAVAKDADAVTRLLVAVGTPDNATQVKYDSSTSNTLGGDYDVYINTAATQGLYTGVAFGYSGTIEIAANNDTFEINVDGIRSGIITLTHNASYTGATLATELQTQINGDSTLSDADRSVIVSFDAVAKVFSITSSTYGTDSTVTLANNESSAEATYGISLSSGTKTTGVNVEGSIGGQSAVGAGRFLTGQGPDTNGLKIETLVGTTGSLGNISFARGFADLMLTFADSLLNTEGAINEKINISNDRIEDITDQRVTLDKRMSALESRLRRQFEALDLLVSQLNATSSFLAQQLDLLPKLNNRRN